MKGAADFLAAIVITSAVAMGAFMLIGWLTQSFVAAFLSGIAVAAYGAWKWSGGDR